ncbi:MAG: Uma2 family endonuclease [Gloeomargarita sp. DG_1_4_bins_134]
MNAVIPMQIPPTLHGTEAQLIELVKANPDLRWELTVQGEVIVMSPTGSETGNDESELNASIVLWNRQQKLGKTFSSSTGLCLPNGAIRSPDGAWISHERWAQLSPAQRWQFASICPDFGVEPVSPVAELETVPAQMQEYLDNGSRWGWLSHPQTRTVAIDCPNWPPETVTFATIPSGEDVLPGLTLDLQTIFV